MSVGHVGFGNILGVFRATYFKALGKLGATAGASLAGGTISGAPTFGLFDKGDLVADHSGKVWICTSAGSPGTWVDSSSGASLNTVVRYHQDSVTAQSISNNTITIIDYDTLDIDTISLVTTGASWKMTATATGNYNVNAAAVLSSALWTGVGYVQLLLYKNGSLYSQLAYNTVQVANTDSFAVNGSDTVPLTATDYIDIRIKHTQGGSVALVGDSTQNYVCINRIT